MRLRLSIGDFSRMTHLSVKALRHYHDLGILEPVETDPYTGYRYYEPEQVPVAQVIRRFRDLGMPLDQVKAVLDAPDVPSRNKAIVVHLEHMQTELARTQATVAGLEALLEGPPRRMPVTLRSIPDADVVAIREVVDTADFAPWWMGAFDELRQTVAGDGAEPAGTAGALYPGQFFELDRAEVTAFVPVSRPVRSKGPASRVESLRVPGGEFAVALHAGPLEEVDRTYGALGTVVAERTIGIDGPIREYYLVGFADTDDQEQHRTEVCWPVFQTAS
ncbi:MerR family transcriptional regulator [Acidiferrimicrobium sp. IK]|uniref:MerR family transcriptional regulator n=1 Tax=Acidiferrimicrobium sp. IK TaxID=2871700 RepID=UPI0021CB02BA|nr:MerR family transcriptional regulator [Acidiferrimicrobium sp. IK]MCU4187180.1 MerR family transcriptional regulator [Acidiferrimicrobium sp. IK]